MDDVTIYHLRLYSKRLKRTLKCGISGNDALGGTL